jgi:hypothetical protein
MQFKNIGRFGTTSSQIAGSYVLSHQLTGASPEFRCPAHERERGSASRRSRFRTARAPVSVECLISHAFPVREPLLEEAKVMLISHCGQPLASGLNA